MKEESNNGQRSAKPSKVILVGSQSVGKSSLLNRIISSKFDPNFTSTIGVDFKTVVVPLGVKQIGLQIWDTAGQEKFKALTQSYFKGAEACICVYDLSDPETLSRAEDYIKYAIELGINHECIFVLGNKCDQAESNEVEKAGREMAENYNVNFLRVSAKDGEGIGNLIDNLATKIDIVFGNKTEISELNSSQLRPRIKIDEKNGRCSC